MTRITATATHDFLGVCKPCQRPVRWTDEARHERFQTATTACIECDEPVKGERVYGTVTANICDLSCMGATGPDCECACGGLQHGINYIPTREGEALASSVTRYRKQAAKRRERSAERAKAKAEAKAAEHAAWREANTDMVDWLTDTRARWTFSSDMLRIIERGDRLTEAQETMTRDMMTRDLAARAEADAWREANADMVAYLAERAADSDFYLDMHDKIEAGYALTERQEAAVRRGMEREEQAKAAPPVPTGRVTIIGTVAEVTGRMERHGYKDVWVPKMLVVTDEGWRIKMTVPADAYDHCRIGEDSDHPHTEKITVTVAVKPGKAPLFGFGSRPTKFAVVGGNA